MRISDWSSDVCSSDLFRGAGALRLGIVHEDFADDAELQDKLSATLKQIMQCAPQANALTKQILLDVGTREMDAVLDDAAQKFAQCVRGNEAPEGIAALDRKSTRLNSSH